jgi:hypothetical protein
MNKEYRLRQRDRWDASRRSERMRFLGSAIGLWVVCASGVCLIGPGDRERASATGLPAHALASTSAHAAMAADRP